jgi:hypothetical protein
MASIRRQRSRRQESHRGQDWNKNLVMLKALRKKGRKGRNVLRDLAPSRMRLARSSHRQIGRRLLDRLWLPLQP